MLTLRPSSERGHANHGWLDTHFSFSFAHYYDPKHMGFGPLRVINEDYIDAGKGFGAHPHDNMEIITYPISGALAHKDSMGHDSTIVPGMIQKMSAGTGIRHSEFNPLESETTHLLQIWIEPDTMNIVPNYEEYNYSLDEKNNTLQLIASSHKDRQVVHIQQSLNLYRCTLDQNNDITQTLEYNNGWLQLISGSLSVNEIPLQKGDGVAINNEAAVTIKAKEASHFLLFDFKR